MTAELAKTKIYIVDDDPSVRKALQRLLHSAGYGVETFASAQEFLQANVQQTDSCLILDIHLEGMSGFELQQHLSESGVKIPIIFISAHDDEEIIQNAEKIGTDFLRKPFGDQTLIDAIKKAIYTV